MQKEGEKDYTQKVKGRKYYCTVKRNERIIN